MLCKISIVVFHFPRLPWWSSRHSSCHGAAPAAATSSERDCADLLSAAHPQHNRNIEILLKDFRFVNLETIVFFILVRKRRCVVFSACMGGSACRSGTVEGIVSSKTHRGTAFHALPIAERRRRYVAQVAAIPAVACPVDEVLAQDGGACRSDTRY
jgi:hypothetical protein